MESTNNRAPQIQTKLRLVNIRCLLLIKKRRHDERPNEKAVQNSVCAANHSIIAGNAHGGIQKDSTIKFFPNRWKKRFLELTKVNQVIQM